MTSIHLPCPQCGEEIEIDMDYQAPEWDTNVSGGWIAGAFTRSCDYVISDAEDDALAAEAEKIANADGEFGITLSAWEEDPR